tara:strand:+ start:10263 stop:11348 length:1086 start_codon:yes stop_codon:yes gene_type:complete
MFAKIQKESLSKLKNAVLPTGKYGLGILIKPTLDLGKVKSALPKAKITIKSKEVKVSQDSPTNKAFFSKTFMDSSYESNFLTAHANNFIQITIPKNTQLKKPIEIHQHIESGPFISLILIKAEANSKAQILLKKSGKANLVADDTRIITESGAKIDFITLQHLGKDVHNIQRRNSHTGKDSEVNWVDVCLGSGYTKSDIISSLQEPGATSNNKVIYFAKNTQKYDIYTASLHNAPNTYSDIVTKGVLNDSAKALSRGLVKINKNAANSNGYETQDALLLSDKAEADAIPNLEILNHDVKCSHGSTVGQIDEESLFYLMSRGLSKKDATAKIVEGYFTPVLDMFQDKNIKAEVHKAVLEGLA